jgi:hypothetical protein
MRKFSEFEKSILKKLVNEEDVFKLNILVFIRESILKNRAIIIDEQKKNINLVYKKSDTSFIPEFFEIISLIQYLEKNHLIFKHTYSESFDGTLISKTYTKENIINPENEDIYIPIPSDVYDLIISYKQGYIIAGTEIKFFVKNKFKSQDDLNHSKEMRIAYCSLVLAFIGLVFALISPFVFKK